MSGEKAAGDGWPCCAVCTMKAGRPIIVRAYEKVAETPTWVHMMTRCEHRGRKSYQEHRIRKPSQDAEYSVRQAIRMLVHTAP